MYQVGNCISFFCDRLPMLLTTFFIACSTAHPAIGAQDTRPDDFRVEYEWRAGSLPPPDHYEYTITITPSGQSKMVLTSDYPFLDPSAVVPEWAEPFHVEEPNLHDLYRVMVENELFTRSWRKGDTPLVPGGSYQTLVVIARGKHITVEDFLVSE